MKVVQKSIKSVKIILAILKSCTLYSQKKHTALKVQIFQQVLTKLSVFFHVIKCKESQFYSLPFGQAVASMY